MPSARVRIPLNPDGTPAARAPRKEMMMAPEAGFDQTAAHKYYSAACFNSTWELLEKQERTGEDNERMVQSAFASLWHWTQRPECDLTKMSIGYWQVSRVFAVLNRPDEARRYGELSLAAAHQGNSGPFYLGYAHEALARAEALSGRDAPKAAHLAEATRLAGLVTDEESRKWLLDDLVNIV
jgi:hypothetical protein